MTGAREYFELSELGSSDASRVAKPISHDWTVQHRLEAPGRLTDPPELTWAWQSSRHPPTDMVFTVDGVRLISPLVRQIFDDHLGADDDIQWLPGTVVTPDGERLPHWVPHFPVHHDLLDAGRTSYGPSGLPIRYVLSADRLHGHGVTVIAGSSVTYVVSRPVADALRAAGATGIRITPAPLS